ncbi:MAG TPA: COX15/CtaA family protein [Casimicrobiaceae bacterium]|nr:COX15/CtaA family protein [Casimicrobiaceae bacterium]
MAAVSHNSVLISPAGLGDGSVRAGHAVAAWLFICCALVFAMVVVGGVTRLTHSGLSITEWQPIVGTLPPMSAADWDSAFSKYQLTPEYQQVNRGMQLAEFQRIFWWEYFHRLLGRLIGVAFLVPFLWFLARRRIPPGYGMRFAGIFALGAAQGALGWYMVRSGLVDDPRVSQFRLTAHLGLAFLIFAAMLWCALSLISRSSGSHAAAKSDFSGTGRLATAVACLVFVQVLAGGMVAGIHAGYAYNTFPLMNGAIVPAEIMMLDPWWKNFSYNMATVQFDHRLLAWILAAAVPVLWWKVVRNADVSTAARVGAHLLLAMLAVQLALGVLTLIHVVPVPLAALHQAGAVLLFALAVNLAHALR